MVTKCTDKDAYKRIFIHQEFENCKSYLLRTIRIRDVNCKQLIEVARFFSDNNRDIRTIPYHSTLLVIRTVRSDHFSIGLFFILPF